MTAPDDHKLPPAEPPPVEPTSGEVACDHCGLPVPSGLLDPEANLQFCCNGCRTVYVMLHEHGLEEFYRVRSVVDAPQQAVHSTAGRYEAFDDPAFTEKHCQGLAGGFLSVDLRLEGVHCAACMWLVERLPKLESGVASAKLQMRDAVVRLTWNPAQAKLSSIATVLDRLGYPAHPARDTTASEIHRRSEHAALIRLGVAGACAGNTMLLAIALYAGDFSGIDDEYKNLFRYVSAAIGGLALVWPGSVFFRGAISALRARSATLDVPIALALAAGGIAGVVNAIRGAGEIYFDSLSVLVFLLLVGRWFQSRQQRWADEAVGLTSSFTPSTCRVVRDGLVVELPTESVKVGDIVEVLSGGVVPADGELVEGSSSLNRSLLTGESHPEAVAVGDRVFAGTQNMDSPIRLRVDTLGESTCVGRLMDMVAQGVREKPPIIEFTDRAAGWFVTIVTLLATFTFIGWATLDKLSLAVEHTIALLIVACPCALGLATPLTMAVAIGLAAKRQMLIKNAAVLEIMARGGRMLLDKTGTLTRGRPTLTVWEGPDWLAPVVAHAESHSMHPIARALVEAFGSQPIPDSANVPRDITEQHGGGLTATVAGEPLIVGSPRFLKSVDVVIDEPSATRIQELEQTGQTTIGVALSGKLVAIAALGDELHADSRQAIQQLTASDWQPTIVSGDATSVVASVAQQLGLPPEQARGGVTPESKLALVTKHRDGGHNEPTVMVGDGVNDAAALAAADVGIAVEGGAEASLAAADVYVATPGLSPIVQLVGLARRTRRTVRQNLVLALGYNVLAVSLAAAGWITPLVAAVLMPISSAIVLASAMSITLGSDS